MPFHQAACEQFLCGRVKTVRLDLLRPHPSNKSIQALFQGNFGNKSQLCLNRTHIGVAVSNIAKPVLPGDNYLGFTAKARLQQMSDARNAGRIARAERLRLPYI
jgi:hypothetical protein